MEKTILDDPCSGAYSENGIKYEEAYHKCKLIDSGATVYRSKLAWAVTKNYPLTEAFNYNIKKIQEIGLIHKYSQ